MGDQLVERGAHVGLRALTPCTRLPGRLEQDEPHAAVLRLLVALERGPGAVAVDVDGLRAQDLLDRRGVEPGQPERREQAERDGTPVRQRS